MNEFKKLGLSDRTVAVIEKKGFTKPSEIQEKTIPVLLAGKHDIIGQAQTGTGKTACFGLPMIEKLTPTGKVQALVLAPTRELAVQVADEINSLQGGQGLSITTIYGGASTRDQKDALRRGVDIVVGTPGRIMDLMKQRSLDISNIQYAVLDEADEMLNMGFVEDIEKILSNTPEDKQMLLFSATMPKEILRIAKRFMREYELIAVEGKGLATELIDQYYFDIAPRDRYAAIKRLVAVTANFHGIIFCKTRNEVDTVARKLSEDKFQSAALHGDISQGQREDILAQFKSKKLNVLVATDVAARGIDVNDLNMVINHSLPQSSETYVHRIGRTGRAGNKGTAITFLIPSERRKLKTIERLVGKEILKGTLPTVQEIIEVKKEEIVGVISKMIQSGKATEYDTIAEKLIAGNNPASVVAAVLRYAFANELDSNSYKDVNTSGRAPASSGGSRDRDRGGRSDRGGSRDRDDRSSGRSDRGGRSEGRSSYGGRSDRGGGSYSSRGRDDRSSGRSSYGGRSEGGSSEGRSFSRSPDRNSSSPSSRGGYSSGRSEGRSSSGYGGRSSESRSSGGYGGRSSEGRSSSSSSRPSSYGGGRSSEGRSSYGGNSSGRSEGRNRDSRSEGRSEGRSSYNTRSSSDRSSSSSSGGRSEGRSSYGRSSDRSSSSGRSSPGSGASGTRGRSSSRDRS